MPSIYRAVYQIKFRIRYSIKDSGSEFAQLYRSVVRSTECNVLKQNIRGEDGNHLLCIVGIPAAIQLSATGIFFCAADICATRRIMDTMVETFLTAASCWDGARESIDSPRHLPDCPGRRAE